MKKLLEVGLGIVAALGGFVDIGDLVFATQAGAKFGLRLLWALALGTLLIMIYAEMSGRVAMVTKRPVFKIIRQRFPKKLALTTLIASTALNILTLAAEIGGVALILQLMSDLPYRALIFAAAMALILIIWILPFQAIEKIFGYLGLGLLVLAVAALKTHPDWSAAAHSFTPNLLAGTKEYWYFAVGIIAATLMPYEVYFYSSGVVEEKWKPKSESVVNKANSILGFGLGGLLVAAIIMVSANLFLSPQIQPEFINTPALAALIPLGKAALLLVLLGMLFSIGGAAIETCFASAYNLSQYFGWKWGKHNMPLEVSRFTLAWLLSLSAGLIIALTGFDPITITEYAVIFSVLVMPLTYLPVLLVARDEKLMGAYKNKPWNTWLGWAALVIITIVAIAAVPLMIITQRGAS